MSTFSRLTPLMQSLPSTVPFVGPETIERNRGLTVKARIGANENGFGPAPSVLRAIAQAAPEKWKYADPDNFAHTKAPSSDRGCAPDKHALGESTEGRRGGKEWAG